MIASRVLLLAFSFVTFVQLCTLVAQGDLRKSAIAGWAELDKATRVSSGKRTAVVPSRGGPRTIVDKWALQGELQKLEMASKVWLGVGKVKYILNLNSDGKWQLEQLHAEEPGSHDASSIRKAGFSIGNVCLLDAAEDSKFEFSNWRVGASGLVEFDVKNLEEARLNRSGIQHQPAVFELVSVQVDPAKNFRLVGFEHSPSQGGKVAKVKTIFQYEEDPYIPSLVKQVSSMQGREPAVWTWANTSISHNALPTSEYSLEHYGLGYKASPGRRWVSILLGLIFLLAAIYLSNRFLRTGGK